jgi:hypothetical protein
MRLEVWAEAPLAGAGAWGGVCRLGQLSKSDATANTYYYAKKVGDQENLVIIAVHFDNAFHTLQQDVASINGIWHISENETRVRQNDQYGRMTVDPIRGQISMAKMENDEAITLSKNKHVALMGPIHIKNADRDTINLSVMLN